MQSEPTVINCACGAAYERRERQLPIKDIGLFACEECGQRIEIWSGRTVPVFKRIEAGQPDRRQA
ncbi:MAG: hypothetical protein ACT4OF_00045 [Caulobacteraceae bacterium]